MPVPSPTFLAQEVLLTLSCAINIASLVPDINNWT